MFCSCSSANASNTLPQLQDPQDSVVIFTMFVLAIFLTFFFWVTIKILRNTTGDKAPPEAGRGWPIIGHLHLLRGPKPPHIVLAELADKYGPIFTIRMGVHRALVVSDSEMAKECLATNDQAFATRPKSLACEVLGYDGAMIGLTQYGSYWRQNRKLISLELLSNQKVEKFKDSGVSEVREFARELHKFWEMGKKLNGSNKVLVEMKRWFGDYTVNLILKLVFRKSTGYVTTENGAAEEWKKALRDFFNLTGTFVVADGLPFLRWLDIGGYERAMKETARRLDLVVEEWLKEHKEKRASGDLRENADFMDIMLDVLDADEEVTCGRDPDTVNKATCLSMVLAGSDTTLVTLSWILLLVVNNPHVLRKIQSELDDQIGQERSVNEADVKNLVYLKAVIMETLRLYPAGPLSVPHESMEAVTIDGYKVQAGTRLLVNLWKIHRDPRVWPDPEAFQPERFLTTHKEVDVRGKNFELIPFSSGRRMCPGISFALRSLQLTMATLFHGFDFTTPLGEPLDMTESIGLTNPPANPLEVLISPRLPPHIYAI